MERRLELKKDLNHQQLLVTSEANVLPRANQRSNPQGKLRTEKRGLSYADLHREITKNVDDVYPRNLGNSWKQWNGKTATGNKGNTVKGKSYLPGNVKKAEHLQKRVLKVEGNLEERQYDDKQIQNNSSRHSVSSINTSSSRFTDESSAGSSGDLNYSPFHQRINHPSLKFYLTSSRSEGLSPVFKPSGEDVGNFQVHNSALKEQTSSMAKQGRTLKNLSAIGFRQHEKKNSEFESDPTSGTLRGAMKCKDSPCTKSQHGEFKKSQEKIEGNPDVLVQNVPGKQRTAALFVPRIIPQKHQYGVSRYSDSTVFLAGRQAETSQKSFLDSPKECQNAEQSSELPLSYLFLSEVDSYRKMQSKHSSFMGAEKKKCASERSRSAPRSRKTESSPSTGRNLEDRRPNLIFTRNEPLKGSDLKSVSGPSEKPRSVSPFRRLSFSIGKTSKMSSSKDGQAVPQLNTTSVSAKTDCENALAPSCIDSSCSDRASASSRGRSSPLRRLLEPLMKPKTGNSGKYVEPARKGLTSNHVRHTILDGQPRSSSLQLGEGRSATVQALFRVTVKNNQPLFTFANDKEHSIITATVKKQTDLEKVDGSWIYTFSTVQEVRKKNGRWINQGGKYQCQDYISSIIAQMRISGSTPSGFKPSSSNKASYMDHCIFREFVLFASDSQPSSELAAIVTKIPIGVDRSLAKNDDKSEIQPKECLTDINTTVILPSGIHSLPHNGGPSSLIQRWKMGGSCDCGGWDMGCNLRILTNHHQRRIFSISSKASSISDRFELFFQGEQQDNQPFFGFSLYKDGIYSVEYNSSLSPLQAFSISIAFYDGRKLLEAYNDRPSKPSDLVEVEVPARYVSYPPLSPVGRV